MKVNLLEQFDKKGIPHNNENVFVENMFIVMKEFGYTLDEVNEMPIPSFFILLEELDKYYKEQNKANKKR